MYTVILFRQGSRPVIFTDAVSKWPAKGDYNVRGSCVLARTQWSNRYIIGKSPF